MTNIIDVKDRGELAIGIEYEFAASYDGRDIFNKVDESPYNWKLGYDCDLEARSNPVVALSEGYDAVVDLIERIKPFDPRIDEGRQNTSIQGMHVHFNVEDERWPSVDVGALFDTYVGKYQDRAFELISSETRRRYGAGQIADQKKRHLRGGPNGMYHWGGWNHDKVPKALRWDALVDGIATVWDDDAEGELTYDLTAKGFDFSPRVFDERGTIEMRTWNATFDLGVLRARFDMLDEMVADAIVLQGERGIGLGINKIHGWDGHDRECDVDDEYDYDYDECDCGEC